jgi:hypothetical protein
MFALGLGIGVNRYRFAGSFSGSYNSRVLADGGISESLVAVDLASDLLKKASLLIVPSGYKESKIYAEIPSNGNGDLTWSRGSDAWRTYSDNTVRRTPWNLYELSGELNNFSYWTHFNVNVTANSIANPINGDITAELVIADTSTNVHAIIKPTIMTLGDYVISVYAKANTGNRVFVGNSSLGVGGFFNLSTGVLEGTIGSVTPTITSIGSGWYRISVALNVSTASTTAFGLYSSFTGVWSTSVVYTGTSESVYMWGAQLNESLTLLPYFPSSTRQNVPRLSYKYGIYPALLLEPQRTNNIQFNEQFNNAYWSTADLTVSPNVAVAPDGNTSADKIIPNTNNVIHSIFKASQSITNSIYSIYAKASGLNWLLLTSHNTSAPTSRGTFFNLSNGTIGNKAVGQTAWIEDVGNGWYRCSIDSGSSSSTIYTLIPTSGNGITSFAGNGTDGILVWGASRETGLGATAIYPTSYIPTPSSAAVTRLADSFTLNNIYSNNLITSSGGTWYIELKNNVSYTRDSLGALWIGDTSTFSVLTNGLSISNNGVTGRLVISKTIVSITTLLYTTLTDSVKLAIKWNGSTVDVFVNGTKVVSASLFTTTNMNFLYGQGSDVPKFIQNMALYSSPLSDADCQTLTT